MDDETKEVMRGMLSLIEQAYRDVHACWAVIGAEAPGLLPLVEYKRRDPKHVAAVRARFLAGYEAIEGGRPSQLREILKTTLGDMAPGKPN